MRSRRHAVKHCTKFSLATRTDDGDLVVGQLYEVFHLDHCILRDLDSTSAQRYLQVLDHTKASKGHLAPMLLCLLEDELNAVQLAGETTDDDAALGPLVHHFTHAVLDVVLTVGVSASTLAVGRFVHHEEEALGMRNILQALEVKLAAIHRVLLNTPVTTTENVPYWCTHHYCGRIRNGVIHPHQLHTKGVTQLDNLMLLRFELMILWLVATIGLGHGALQHT